MSYCHSLKILDERQSRERKTASIPLHSLKAIDLSLDRQHIKFDVNGSKALRARRTVRSVANGTAISSQQNIENRRSENVQGRDWFQDDTEIK